MAISDRIPSPAFVDLGTRSEKGLDVLGLRLPAQQLGEQLLDGVTSVTPTLRYLSLRTWLLWRYATADPPQPNEYRAFREYVRRAEAAFAIGNLMHGPVPTTLIGSREAPHRFADGADEISLEPLAKQPALGIYAGPSADLSLTKANPQPPGIPVWDEELAEPLARATDEALARTALGQRLGRGELLESATRDDLEEFGLAAAALDIPKAERRALIDVILPKAPMPHERNRIATYGALLALGDNLAARFAATPGLPLSGGCPAGTYRSGGIRVHPGRLAPLFRSRRHRCERGILPAGRWRPLTGPWTLRAPACSRTR